MELQSNEQQKHEGGRLEGHVLLPKDAQIQFIGGHGLEFFVDGTNYDEDGVVQELAKKEKAESGAWRVEVSPPADAYEDRFLVVLLPTGTGSPPGHQVRLLEEDRRVGCEIIGPERTTRWWFDPEFDGPVIDVLSATGDRRTHDLRMPSLPRD